MSLGWVRFQVLKLVIAWVAVYNLNLLLINILIIFKALNPLWFGFTSYFLILFTQNLWFCKHASLSHLNNLFLKKNPNFYTSACNRIVILIFTLVYKISSTSNVKSYYFSLSFLISVLCLMGTLQKKRQKICHLKVKILQWSICFKNISPFN